MKQKSILAFLLSVLSTQFIHAFTIYNAPFAFERQYNANSFILNSSSYYKQYVPKKQSLGEIALKKIQTKKLKQKKGRRLFTQYTSEK